jgi:hypothetical protein
MPYGSILLQDAVEDMGITPRRSPAQFLALETRRR